MKTNKDKKKTRRSLIFKISIVVCCVFIFSASLLGIIIFKQFSSVIIEDIRTSLSARLDNEANIIYNSIFSKIETKSMDYALFISNIGFENLEFLNDISRTTMGSDHTIVGGGFWLEPYVIKGEKFYGPYWYTQNNEVKMTWEYSNEKNDYKKFDWYKNDGISENKKLVWSELYNDEITGVPMITATAPILLDKKKLGVVTIDLGLTPLSLYFENLEFNDITRYSLSLVNKNGICLNNKNKDIIGKKIFEPRPDNEKIFETGKTLLFISPIEDTGIYITIEVTKATIFKDFYRLLALNIIIAAVFVFVLIFTIIFSMKKILVKPLFQIGQALKQIASGDLTVRLPINSRDEVAELSLHFNNAMEQIGSAISSFEKNTQIMSSIGNELASNMTETASAVNQINASIDGVKQQAGIQAASVDTTSKTIDTIINRIQNQNESIESQAASVAQSSSAIKEMTANISSITQTIEKTDNMIGELANATASGKENVASSNTITQQIAEESGSLLEASSVIQHIASQTNLLAMNAAIEAAHAGESGKGFAVVADEIRKLAEESATQAKTITSTLKNLSTEIETLSGSAKKAEEQFNFIFKLSDQVKMMSRDLTDAMKKQENGSREVLFAIQEINSITEGVTYGSAEMLEGGEAVADEMKKLNNLTDIITNSMSEMASGAVQINLSIQEVTRISQKNKKSIEILSEEVKKFKV
ncbi:MULTISPECIES: methyl-accepting chemotaxis protein [unclassified Treponema]|uniref:methyl-accepting chemotaxis protein n=1 Tax=unclassified Treponema TaxID=2638727 RepID=UPI0020A2D586|nr:MULTISPECIES: methyl-accepting chemotaxis protein [unclassified Treponema]UTC66734.1 HAMP domain-containing protein [Treponema sp. OMZ 789]UTC69466.1 HAMP domain-containing protein [Treponema sp. OMZ 790]UTC72180.1 HAMP domain-containing protein [Treponema sp. OMZ 791]